MSSSSVLDPRRTIDVFVGGPLNNTHPDGAGLLMKDYLPNLREAIGKIIKDINASWPNRSEFSYDPVQLVGPSMKPTDGANIGMIKKKIFSAIDEADVAIMDVTGPSMTLSDGSIFESRASPDVIYELGFLHALGVPTIPISLEGRRKEFYLEQYHTTFVKNFETDTLLTALRETLTDLCLNYHEEIDDWRSNPISEHYNDVALVDISSTQGLATGYFHNFLRIWISTEFQIFTAIEDAKKGSPKEANLLQFSSDSELDTLKGLERKIVILKPNSISELNSSNPEFIKGRLESKLKEAGIKFGKFTCYQPAQRTSIGTLSGEPFRFSYAGRYIYDIPFPLIAMQSAPRYKRSRNKVRSSAISIIDKLADYDRKLINSFVDLIETMISDQEKQVRKDHHKILSLDDFVKLVLSDN
ncbi:MAG: hypothetical protein AB7F96_13570 [Beijerinckiaceae bacterium]